MDFRLGLSGPSVWASRSITISLIWGLGYLQGAKNNGTCDIQKRFIQEYLIFRVMAMRISGLRNSVVYEERTGGAGGTHYVAYQVGKHLGKGGFANCYEVTRAHEEVPLALKVIPKPINGKPDAIDKIKAEIRIMAGLSHHGVVKAHHSFADNENIYILLELCVNGSLGDMLKRRKWLSEPEVRYLVAQMGVILTYLKSQNIIHRDIKLANYFLDEHFRLRLGDFGLATVNDDEFRSKRNVCGTPNYIAPEIIEKKPYSFEVDAWSTGVLVFTLLFGTPPFQTKSCRETYDRIRRGLYKFEGANKSTSVSEHARNFIRDLLQLDPQMRLKVQDFSAHPFIRDFHLPLELEPSFLSAPPSHQFIRKYGPCLSRQLKATAKSIKMLADEVTEHTEADKNEEDLDDSFSSLGTIRLQSPAPRKLKPKPPVSKAIKKGSVEIHVVEESIETRIRKPILVEQKPVKEEQNIITVETIQSQVLTQRPLIIPRLIKTVQKKVEPKPKKLQFKTRQKKYQGDILVVQWMNRWTEWGIGYQLSDGSIGLLFNDHTSLLLDKQQNIHQLPIVPNSQELPLPKLQLLLRAKENFKKPIIISPKQEGEYKAIYVRSFALNSDVAVFRLSNGSLFCEFTDKMQLVVSGNRLFLPNEQQEHLLGKPIAEDLRKRVSKAAALFLLCSKA